MGMIDSQPHPNSNRASMDGISDKEEEEVEAPELVPTRWGYPGAYSYPKQSRKTCFKANYRTSEECLF